MKKIKIGIVIGLIALALCFAYAIIRDVSGKNGGTVTKNNYPNVDPEFKKFWDSYEEVMNEYCDFMEKYTKGGASISMMADYAKMVAKYAEMGNAASKYDTNEMTEEEYAYYIDVMTRVQKRLLSITAK